MIQTEIKPVRFLDLSVADDERARLLATIESVLRHGRLVLGPEVAAFERAVAGWLGAGHAVGVSSGTAALYFAVKALGIGPGDEVITTPMSFIATANSIAATGATPVFADVGDDLNLDPATIEPLISSRTRAVMPVHYTGKTCRMDEIGAIAQQHGLFIIEDASQAFGAMQNGRAAGTFGDVGCISLNPMKLLAACGEAGVVVTERDDLRDRLEALRYNGLVDREHCHHVSLNGRLDTLQAAILLERIKGVDHVIKRRRQIAAHYHDRLSDVVAVPMEQNGCRDVYYTYTVRTPRRDELKAQLDSLGVEAKVYHPLLMPQHKVYRQRCERQGHSPNAERLVGEILCLPVHEKLTDDEVAYVADSVRSFFGA